MVSDKGEWADVRYSLLLVFDASQLPFDTGFFDRIFMSFTLELFDTADIPAVLAECGRTLKRWGRMCIVSISRVGRLSLVARLYEWLYRKLPASFDWQSHLRANLSEKSGVAHPGGTRAATPRSGSRDRAV